MANDCITMREVLYRLRKAGHVDIPDDDTVSDFLARRRAARDPAWFVSALAGAGAWAAAIFFIAFLFTAKIIDRGDWHEILPWGLAFLVAANLLRHFTRSVFPVQLALALSTAGHIMTLAGVEDYTNSIGYLAAAAVVLSVIQYPLNRDLVHRFLSVLTATGLVLYWIMDMELHIPLYGLIAAEMVLVGLLYTWGRTPPVLRPLAAAFATALVGTHLVWIGDLDLGAPLWPARILGVAWMLWVLRFSADGGSLLRREPLVVAMAATVLLGVFSPPGLLAAIGLMVLGHALGDRLVTGLGTIFMPVFIYAYYHDLALGLDQKSYHLMAAGLVLLVARAYLARRPWARKEAP